MTDYSRLVKALQEASDQIETALEGAQNLDYDLGDDEEEREEMETEVATQLVLNLQSAINAFRVGKEAGLALDEGERRVLLIPAEDGSGSFTQEVATVLDEALLASLANVPLIQQWMDREIKQLNETIAMVRK